MPLYRQRISRTVITSAMVISPTSSARAIVITSGVIVQRISRDNHLHASAMVISQRTSRDIVISTASRGCVAKERIYQRIVTTSAIITQATSSRLHQFYYSIYGNEKVQFFSIQFCYK